MGCWGSSGPELPALSKSRYAVDIGIFRVSRNDPDIPGACPWQATDDGEFVPQLEAFRGSGVKYMNCVSMFPLSVGCTRSDGFRGCPSEDLCSTGYSRAWEVDGRDRCHVATGELSPKARVIRLGTAGASDTSWKPFNLRIGRETSQIGRSTRGERYGLDAPGMRPMYFTSPAPACAAAKHGSRNPACLRRTRRKRQTRCLGCPRNAAQSTSRAMYHHAENRAGIGFHCQGHCHEQERLAEFYRGAVDQRRSGHDTRHCFKEISCV